MEATCMRGFSNSFLPDTKAETTLMEIEKSPELERTWKSVRRQRLKQQEEKIWTEFVKEQDILNSVCQEDPYQFLEQLPEAHLKDLMDSELERIKLEVLDDCKEQKRGAGDTPRQENQQTVSFSEIEQDDLFQIFDEDKDELSGGEEGAGERASSPSTVRERSLSPPSVPTSPPPPQPQRNLDVSASKSSEDVATVIESSIYCAKVKDLRLKINNALIEIMNCIENVNLSLMESQQLRSMCRRAAEFSNRFQRIHLYQIQRQVYDIKRHNSQALPFAKHTQFQSQMVRIVALHQYTLQALQVFLKSIDQTSCLKESAEQIKALCLAIKESLVACKECAPPQDFSAATELYNDKVETTCDKLEMTVKLYTERVSDIVASAQNTSTPHHVKSNKNKDKKKKSAMWIKSVSKANSRTEATARLSMYSLATLRQQPSKGNTSKDNKGAKSSDRKRGDKVEMSPKNHKKSPRSSRRPLMRSPHGRRAAAAAARAARGSDADLHTMVEAVPSPSTLSQSPALSPTDRTPTSARTNTAPHADLQSPKMQSKRQNAPIKQIPPLHNIQSETHNVSIVEPLSPVSKIHCYAKPKKLEQNDFAEANNKQTNKEVKHGNHNDSPAKRSDDNLRLKIARDHSKIHDAVPKGNDQGSKLDCEVPRLKGVKDEASSARSGSCVKISGASENAPLTPNSGRLASSSRKETERKRVSDRDPAAGCEVTRLLRQLCGGDASGSKHERYTGAKNAQLLCVNGGSPRQPSTPQLLRILEETIQKKVPKSMCHKSKPKDVERLRLAFNIPQHTADYLFQYRTKFVQHMLASSLYANSAVGKPWEMIGSVSDIIIDEVLLKCTHEMQLEPIIQKIYQSETQ